MRTEDAGSARGFESALCEDHIWRGIFILISSLLRRWANYDIAATYVVWPGVIANQWRGEEGLSGNLISQRVTMRGLGLYVLELVFMDVKDAMISMPV